VTGGEEADDLGMTFSRATKAAADITRRRARIRAER